MKPKALSSRRLLTIALGGLLLSSLAAFNIAAEPKPADAPAQDAAPAKADGQDTPNATKAKANADAKKGEAKKAAAKKRADKKAAETSPKTNNAAQATPAKSLRLLPGFKAELLYTVPAETQGSWVAMCEDAKGRLIVSDQYGALYRVTPPALNASPNDIKIEEIPADIGTSNGLLWAFDSLYVVVNDYTDAARNGVYRVTDTDKNDMVDKVEQLQLFTGGGSDHGPHAALLSPDGKSIFIVVGNKTDTLEVDHSRVNLNVGEDHLLPRMPDGRGFMRDKLAPGGNIYKMSPDGKDFELYATGFRNEYDAAFNRDGELFAYDADMEYDFNTSWYRPNRVNHVISGAEFGWRNGAGKWPAWYEDSFGSVVDVGPGSPTGVVFGYGAKFPAKYQNALFINDWSWGKMYAVHMTPDGSTYTGVKEEFISGSPLPLTDVVVRKEDGAMYFAIGGRKAQSGLYRVTYVGDESTANAADDTTSPEAKKARELRHQLEALHTDADRSDAEQAEAMKLAWAHLGSDDRGIRYAARTALEHLPAKAWQEQALAEKDAAKQITALLGLVRITSTDPQHATEKSPKADKALQGKILSALSGYDFAKLSQWQKLALLRTYAVCFVRMGEPTDAQRQVAVKQLDAAFPADSIPVNYDLCMTLAYLQSPTLAAKAVPMLLSAPSQEEQIEYGRSLRMLKAGWTPELRKQQFEWLNRAFNYRGGASFSAFIEMIRTDTLATLSDTEKTQLKSFIDNPPVKQSPLELLSAGLAGREKVKDWTVDDLAGKGEQSMHDRNFEQGRRMFGTVACFACHRFGNEGGMVGPDLTAVGGRFGVRDLLTSIIEPSKEVSDQFAPIVVKTLDGDQIIGRIVNLKDDTVMVNTDLFNPVEQTAVDRNNVKSIEMSKTSLMPEGLVNYLKEEEIYDLLAYMISQGNPEHPVYKKQSAGR